MSLLFFFLFLLNFLLRAIGLILFIFEDNIGLYSFYIYKYILKNNNINILCNYIIITFFDNIV